MLTTNNSNEEIVICSYEDRPQNLIGWKFLLLSIQRHSPTISVYLFSKRFPDHFLQWLKKHVPKTVCKIIDESSLWGWNNKALVIDRMLEDGFNRVLWLDSDLVLTHDIRPRLQTIAEEAIGITEENGLFDDRRVVFHELEVGRRWNGNFNTCVLLLSRKHHQLLVKKWKFILEGSKFQSLQALSHEERPIYCWSEQDVFAGLLCGKPPEGYSHIDMDVFRRGSEIIHVGASHRIKSRIRAAFSKKPFFVHAQGMKPWDLPSTGRYDLRMMQIELSEYVTAIQDYISFVEEEVPWAKPRSKWSQTLNLVFLGNPHLSGIPIMLLSDLKRLWNG